MKTFGENLNVYYQEEENLICDYMWHLTSRMGLCRVEFFTWEWDREDKSVEHRDQDPMIIF